MAELLWVLKDYLISLDDKEMARKKVYGLESERAIDSGRLERTNFKRCKQSERHGLTAAALFEHYSMARR
jgi:hypothetical protein